jgi:hypothetical protein
VVSIPAGTLVPRDARAFGAYELIAKIATGGMAEIYLARGPGNAGTSERVVVKRILPTSPRTITSSRCSATRPTWPRA